MQYNIFVKTRTIDEHYLYIGSLPVKPDVKHFHIIVEMIKLQDKLNHEFFIAHLPNFLYHGIDTIFSYEIESIYSDYNYRFISQSLSNHSIATHKLNAIKSDINKRAIQQLCSDYKVGQKIAEKLIDNMVLNTFTDTNIFRVMATDNDLAAEIAHMAKIFADHSFLDNIMSQRLDNENSLLRTLHNYHPSRIWSYSIVFSNLFYKKFDWYKHQIHTREIDKRHDWVFDAMADELDVSAQLINDLYILDENVFTKSGKNAIMIIEHMNILIQSGYAISEYTLPFVDSFKPNDEIVFNIKPTVKLIHTINEHIKSTYEDAHE